MLRRLLRSLNPAEWITRFAKWWLRHCSTGVESEQQGRAAVNANGPAFVVRRQQQLAPCKPPGAAADARPLASQNNHMVQHASTSGAVDTRHQEQLQHNGLHDDCAADRQRWINSTKEQVFSWDFNVFEFGNLTRGQPLITMTLTLLEVYGLLDGWKINRRTMENFLQRVESEYKPNSYHNNIHATDVTQTAAIILQSFAKQVTDIPKLDTFCIIMASAVHDLGHLGVNNDFLINSKHQRATTYNDKSVNENYHVSRAFDIARNNHGCNVFEQFTHEEQKRCRKLMIDMVLSTDMAIHFDLLKSYNSQMEAKPDLNEWQERNLLYQMIVHLADIANPSRPFYLARGWAERVIQEFCEQGDKEAAAGLSVSPFCNRANMNMPRAQLNFIDIFLKPTLLSFERAAPEFISMALQYLDKTIEQWKELEAGGFKM